ncbi:MAG TPA: hypothetical protein VIK01_03915 [Polyangiaceae bacterium]
MTEPESVHQEPDLVPGRRLLLLAGSAVFVSALGVLVSWWMLRSNPASHPPPRTISSAAFATGTPEQTPIDTTERGLTLRAEQLKQLASYGWADRDAGIARIPIERAMDLRAEGLR